MPHLRNLIACCHEEHITAQDLAGLDEKPRALVGISSRIAQRLHRDGIIRPAGFGQVQGQDRRIWTAGPHYRVFMGRI